MTNMTKIHMTKVAAAAALATFAVASVAFAADANVGIRVGAMMNGGQGGPDGGRGAMMGGQAQFEAGFDQNEASNQQEGPSDGQGRSGDVRIIRQGIMMRSGDNARPAVIGVVTAIDGSTITIASRGFAAGDRGDGRSATGTRQRGMYASSTRPTMMPPIMAATSTFTIDASAATVIKAGATTTLSSVSVGDFILVRGAVSGSKVTATEIRDTGANPPMMGGRGPRGMVEASTTASTTFGFGRGNDEGSNPGAGDNQPPRGFFGAIGHFFKSLFGF